MKRIITAAALAAALLAGAPRAAAVCPYTVGPLGRYIAPATVQGMTATDDGNAVEVWCTDALDGDDWFFRILRYGFIVFYAVRNRHPCIDDQEYSKIEIT